MDQHQKLGLLSDVKKDIQALEKELADLRVVEAYLTRSASSSPDSQRNGPPQQAAHQPQQQSGRFASVKNLAEAAQTILREHGPRGTMRSGDIAEVLARVCATTG